MSAREAQTNNVANANLPSWPAGAGGPGRLAVCAGVHRCRRCVAAGSAKQQDNRNVRRQGAIRRRWRPGHLGVSRQPRSRGGRWRRQHLHCGHQQPPHPQGQCLHRKHLDRRRIRDIRLQRRWRRGQLGEAQLPKRGCSGWRWQPIYSGHFQPPHPQGRCLHRKHLDRRRIRDIRLQRRWRRGQLGTAQLPKRGCSGRRWQPIYSGHFQPPHPQGRCLQRKHLDRRRIRDGRLQRRWRRGHLGAALSSQEGLRWTAMATYI